MKGACDMKVDIKGAYVPVIGYLEQEGSLTLDELKKYYIGKNMNDSRKEKFEEWIKKLQKDHVVTVEYGVVTFNREQWDNITGK